MSKPIVPCAHENHEHCMCSKCRRNDSSDTGTCEMCARGGTPAGLCYHRPLKPVNRRRQMIQPKFEYGQMVYVIATGHRFEVDGYHCSKRHGVRYDLITPGTPNIPPYLDKCPESDLSASPPIPENASVDELVAIAERPIDRMVRRVKLLHAETSWQAMVAGRGEEGHGATPELALRALIARLQEEAHHG